jgi:hypothetical protein
MSRTTFRSVTHGTCALNGQHRPGSKYAAECPVLRRQNRGAKPRNRAGNTNIAGRLPTPSESDGKSGTSEEGFAPLAAARERLGRPGRPATGRSRWARRRRHLRA